MKSKLTVMDVKQAIWNKNFRDLFPEFKDAINRHLQDPGCACNLQVILSLMSYKDRMKQYFPDKEIVTPEEPSAPPNNWAVINCHINQLQDKMRKVQPGKRMVAVARWRDRVTTVLNDIDTIIHLPKLQGNIEEQVKEAKEAKINWVVINTTIHELLHGLRKLSQGPKTLVLTRWQEQITVIVHDRGTIF